MLNVFASSALGGAYGHGILISIITFPDAESQAALFLVINALDAQRPRFGFGQRWQQHGRQNRNNRDHNEQFNERERPDFITESLHIFLILFVFSANSLRTLKNPPFLSTLS